MNTLKNTHDARSKVVSMRKGQKAFNALYEVRADLADQIRSNSELDPFYRDENLPAFYLWLEKQAPDVYKALGADHENN